MGAIQLFICGVLFLAGSGFSSSISGIGTSSLQSQQQQQHLQLQQAQSANEVLAASASDSIPILASSPSDNQYRATYYYPVRTSKTGLSRYATLNRDSYTDAASDYGYGTMDGGGSVGTYQAPVAYQTQGHAATYGSPAIFASSDDSLYDLESQGTSLGGLGGLGGLSGLGGLLGLKGLKGLGILGFLKGSTLLPLLVLGLPLFLLALPLLLLFLPVPVITIPTNSNGGRSWPSFGLSEMTTNFARTVLESDKCVERFSCEIGRFNKGTFLDKALTGLFSHFEAQLPGSLKRVAKAYLEKPTCKKFTCNLVESKKKKSL